MARGSGQVTLKLPYPVVVEEISIDHVSVDIIPIGWENSAPKQIKVVGYLPCDEDNDDECQSMGFSQRNPMEIAQFTYDIKGPSVQTFDSHYGKAMKDLAATTQENKQSLQGGSDDDDAAASCSAEATSCTSPPKKSVAAISFKVYENWGNAELTCLYRVRVHGEPEFGLT
jgi:Sad1 / UNC-like C-terminal